MLAIGRVKMEFLWRMEDLMMLMGPCVRVLLCGVRLTNNLLLYLETMENVGIIAAQGELITHQLIQTMRRMENVTWIKINNMPNINQLKKKNEKAVNSSCILKTNEEPCEQSNNNEQSKTLDASGRKSDQKSDCMDIL